MSGEVLSDGSTRSYEGGAFLDATSTERRAGTITVDRGLLRFDSPDHRVEMPLRGLELKLGGASNRLVFFSHPRTAGASVFTSDHSILKDPALRGDAAVMEQIGGVGAKKSRGRAFTMSVLLVLAAAVFGLFQSKDLLVGLVVDRIPPSAEAKLGDAVFKQIEMTTDLSESEEIAAMMAELTAPLVAAVPERDVYDFRFHVANDPVPNAFALPGGNIVVHTGLIMKAERPEEILGVLGHEIAHVTKRHSTRQLVGTVGLFALVQLLFGDASGIAAVVVSGGAELASLSYSRDHESESDDAGWEYLSDAGIDPEGLIDFFERLREEEAENPLASAAGESLSFMSTHPATRERIERLREKLKATDTDAIAPVDFDLGALKRAIRKEQGEP